MKLKNLSLQKSLEDCPSEKSITEEGVIWEDRIIAARNRIEWLIEDQPRETSSDEKNVKKLRIDYENFGFDSTKPPQAIKEHPTKEGWYVGRKGFNREAAQSDLSVTECIYDLVSFETAWDEHCFKWESNETAEHCNVSKENTLEDIIKGIIESLDTGFIVYKTDDEVDFKKQIYNFLGRVYYRHPHLHEKAYKAALGQHSPYKTLRTYTKKSANQKCQELGVPFSGNGNKQILSNGYAMKGMPGKDMIDSGKKSYAETQNNVYMTMYVECPNLKNIDKRRKALRKGFDTMIDNELFWHMAMNHKLIDPLKEDAHEQAFRNFFPIQFAGFLPQKDGEVGLVDENGKAIENPPNT